MMSFFLIVVIKTTSSCALENNYDSKDQHQVLTGYSNLVPRPLSLVLVNNQKLDV